MSDDELSTSLIYQQVLGRTNDNTSALATHRVKVFHAAILKILKSAKTAAGKDGFSFSHGAQQILAKFVIAILSMDYEEAYVFSNFGPSETHSLAALVQRQYSVQILNFPVLFVWSQSVNYEILPENIHPTQRSQPLHFCMKPKLHQPRRGNMRSC